MLSSIAAITIPLLLLLFITFFIFDNNRKKRIAEAKQALNSRVSDSKNSYKIDVERFCDETSLPKVVRDKLYTVANNFFVYQSINEDNVAVFEIATSKLSKSFADLLHHFNEYDDLETVHERIELFVDNLPTQPRGYNAGFYQNSLTTLNHLLMIPEEALVDKDEDSEQPSDDKALNDEVVAPEPIAEESSYDQARSA
ncbi:hypothetical protein MHM98_05880 [Psychrobium sp. MM17-31]|uniref:hypothetical protein n=1 Tax=Psychrobium sp. MM17-31 TaxID=2917758 RepID=UPI001EF40EED|nr:hypothetical protein [Psychrobium sp. MM17-31]MCG7530885.1 hypothetical protein [Psychrobium sp. MM17-31]